MRNSSDKTQLSLLTITWPIWVENMLRTSFLSLETLMLANYSEEAVAAMSLVHTVGFFIQLLYFMVGLGANILISQNLGAGKPDAAGKAGVASLVLILGFSAVVSIGLAAFTEPLVSLFHLAPVVHACAVAFIRIYSGFSLFLALNIVQSNILQAFGYSKYSMVVNVVVLGTTVLLCLFGLYGPFGFSAPSQFNSGSEMSQLVFNPALAADGVTWVASMTVVGQLVACVVFVILLGRNSDIQLPLRQVFQIPKKVYQSILKIGVPSAGETLSYNLSQIVILSMVSTMGTHALAAYGILFALLRYVFMSGISIGTGAQIKVGYFAGAGMHSEAYRRVYQYFGVGFGATLILVSVLYLFATPLLSLFSDNPAVLALAASVLLISVVHEPGRSLNTIFIPGLKGAGDALFPALLGLVMMWSIGVPLAWVLGVHLGWGLVGVWIALAFEEWLRGIVILLRWRSRAWVKHSLV